MYLKLGSMNFFLMKFKKNVLGIFVKMLAQCKLSDIADHSL